MADQKKILVVDDEPDMVEWLTTFFEDNGYATIFAHDGFDGFEKVLSEKPDLITLDITMNRESGCSASFMNTRRRQRYRS